MERPGLHEHDAGSYLHGALDVHRVLRRRGDGWQVDGSPDWELDADAPDPACRDCAYAWARSAGFEGPITLAVAYQPGLPLRDEEVLVRRDAAGDPEWVAVYGYGRAYFEPGQPRTTPCAKCGAETLRDMPGLDPPKSPIDP